MAIRNIRTKEDDILRKKSKVVTNIDDRLLTLINDMKETMYASNGVGLAAPQVGILKRVVVVDIGEGPIVLINPEIIEKSGEVTDLEGCLSVPGQQGMVKRPKYVKVKAMNEKGEDIVLEGEDYLARAFCHEIDHLDGILYIDKIVKEQEA
ncbi:MAG: peptide deformylase [Clostridium argentinense]|uniref:Peptide deformylase n=1 Tax=Clostridium faecium TaxID=2762223 RepID=A0ABR8YQ44_9CLOT|nr:MULTISPECIES: peptide deformylase [Clostridium]MBD8046133.1 peptide deformylase [Clostridium faecium]MBS5824053.1 peptide deformylase [Clostridium argentinense]MDU1347701.1 peptide deformylase [Clostridium argentinense]